MGKQMNNQTWGLLSKTDRSEDDNEKMVYFAKASLYNKKKVSNK